MTLWIVTHEHRHGTTSYLVRFDGDPFADVDETEKALVQQLNIDFEPRRSEFLGWESFDETEIPTVKLGAL